MPVPVGALQWTYKRSICVPAAPLVHARLIGKSTLQSAHRYTSINLHFRTLTRTSLQLQTVITQEDKICRRGEQPDLQYRADHYDLF